jgi:hypothetical protein
MKRIIILMAVMVAALSTATAASAQPYPAGVRAAFIRGCSSGAPRQVCVCTMNYVKAHESLLKFERQLLRHQVTGRVPVILRRAVRACLLA